MTNQFIKVNQDSYLMARKSQPLFGSVNVSGAKNMVTKIMTACLIAKKGKLTIHNVPIINEIFITLSLFDQLGVKYRLNPDKSLEIEPRSFASSKISFANQEGNRISLLLAAPILAEFGEAKIAKPKGCQIGKRKINFHLNGLKKFGVKIKENKENLHLKVGRKGLKGARFKLPFPSVGATENMIMTAVCAHGESLIENCAIEPEIIELIKFLQKAGVSIAIYGERTIRIIGNKNIELSDITVIPDRVETFSWAAAALATKGDIFVRGAKQELMISALSVLQEMGAGIEIRDDGIRFYYQQKLKPVSVKTEVYPGFATDFQQPLAILASQIEGTSYIHETIFDHRFTYLELLQPLMAKGNIKIKQACPRSQLCRFHGKNYPHLAEINGPIKFTSGEISICDLRAGFAILIAGLLSQGIKIKNVGLLFRGYEDPIGKLKPLGADVELKI